MSQKKLFNNLKKEMKYKGIEIPSELISLKKAYDSTEIKQLVSYNDFKKFIMENVVAKYSTKRGYVIGLNALQLRSKRFTQYVTPDSNKQFITLYYMDNTQLIGMLNYFVGMKDTEIIIIMIKNNKLDEEILEYIKNNLTFKNTEESKEFRNSKIAGFLNHFYLQNKDNIKFLDIGTGNGKKIKSITSYLNSTYELYGTDIEEWGPYKKERKIDFTFKVIQMNPYKIPYDDKMFDCIFIILTLHHVKNIIKLLKECYRILKDDGCILIIEHDVWTDETHMLVDLQHRIYCSINKEESEGIKATYYNFFEWDIIFNKCGFKFIRGDKLQDDISFNIRYDMPHVKIYCKKEHKYKLCLTA